MRLLSKKVQLKRHYFAHCAMLRFESSANTVEVVTSVLMNLTSIVGYTSYWNINDASPFILSGTSDCFLSIKEANLLGLAAVSLVKEHSDVSKEDGRCKRTDGMKCRCTKDVAPQQKFCEPHLHRGRPRSRKPVEPKSSKHNKTTRPVPFSLSTSQQATVASTAANNNGDLGLVVEAGLNVAHQQLMMDVNMGFTSDGCESTHLFEKEYEYILRYSNPGAPEINTPAGFIDNSNNIVNGENVPPSLDLSMTIAIGNILDDEMGKAWESGGPLAEALHSASPHDSITTPATTVSSPSGVLQRILFSNSDSSSIYNSPILDVPFHRLS